MNRRVLGAALVLAVAAILALRATATPRGTRSWVPEQSRVARVEIAGDTVRIHDVRSFLYGDSGSVTPRWVDRTYRLDRLERVWFAVSPFGSWRGPAHTFLSFEFSDSTFVSVSVEARREVGEEYSPLKGVLRRYELIEVIGEEPDVIGLRADVWNDPVYLYPGRATPAQARALFLALMEREQGLVERPEYYNTLTNNCATNLAWAVNRIAPKRARWSPALLFPGYADDYAEDRGLLDVPEPLDSVRERYRINARAHAAWHAADYSFAIRGG
jgi:hypothetical protein